MAVKREGAIQRFTCLDADSKPTSGVPIGSRLTVTDIGMEYIYDGSAWKAIRTIALPYTYSDTQRGNRFTATHWVSVGTGTAASMLITTPASATVAECHFTYTVTSSAQVKVEFGEDANASGGTALTEYNMDRKSTNTADVVTTHTATWVSSGSILSYYEGTLFGGEAEAQEDYILDHSTIYIIYITAYGAATEVAINAYWTED